MRWHTKRLVSLSILFALCILCAISARLVVAQAPPAGIQKINHVVWIIQENRSFDNYFAKYPGADGIPPGTCLPKLPGSSDCVKPFHMPPGQPAEDLNHDWETIHAAYNNGAMDGFVWSEGTSLTMGYYDESDIPNYWNYARHFTLCDRFFSSQMGYSLPNHVYTVAGQSGGLIVNVANLKELEDVMDDPDGFSFASVAELMSKSDVPWKYYVESQPLPQGEPMKLSETGIRLAFPKPRQFSLWNPLPGFKKIRDNPAQMAHLVDLKEYTRDLQAGTLPAVSWIIPDYQDSEHPTASYDHVPPPEIDAEGLGPRVPMLVISPYARANYVSHDVYEFSSVLKFIEERWGLHHLTPRDHWANGMRDCFDFNQAPNPPMTIAIPPKLPASRPILDYVSYPPSVPLPKYTPPKRLNMVVPEAPRADK